MDAEHVDVLIVGAGLSGIGAACHLTRHCPSKTFAILEARETIGGTWDLFRYPGIRSDSDMFTLGYSFRPWREAEGDRRRPLDPRATSATPPANHGVRAAHPLRPPRAARATGRARDARWTVAGRARRHGRDGAASRATSSTAAPATTATTRATARASGQRALPRRDRPPPALARGPRLRRTSASW